MSERAAGSRSQPPLSPRDGWALGGLLAVGAALRLAYLVQMDLPVYDPWRHLALIRNLRAGLGFTLFDGQPYLWYGPLWYRLCAAMPSSIGPEWVAAVLSLLCVPGFYWFLRGLAVPRPDVAAAAGGLLMAASGPLIAFTCHYGPESLALFLLVGALLVCSRGNGLPSAGLAGLAFGLSLVLRMNFVFAGLLFLPWARSRRVAGLAGGAALPLLLTWWRNHRIIGSYPFVFTWDGLATRSQDFDWLSTLVVQMHPAVQQALRRLHLQIVPSPEWIRGPGGDLAWGLLLFVGLGTVGFLAGRNLGMALAGSAAMGYFLWFDRTLSSHFFRIYLVVFPSFFGGLALLAGRLAGFRRRRWLGAGAVAAALVGGAGMLRPPPSIPLEAVTPPEGLVGQGAYLVNSGFYHPESLIYRDPDSRFVGMPLDPAQFEAFRREYPDYRFVLWHDFSVQSEMANHLARDPEFELLRSGRNRFGRFYFVLGTPVSPAGGGP